MLNNFPRNVLCHCLFFLNCRSGRLRRPNTASRRSLGGAPARRVEVSDSVSGSSSNVSAATATPIASNKENVSLSSREAWNIDSKSGVIFLSELHASV